MADETKTRVSPGDLALAATVLGERAATLRSVAESRMRNGMTIPAGEYQRDADRLERVSRLLLTEANNGR